MALRETDRAGDALYLVTHHCATGKPLVGPRSVGLGLAAALLAELMLAGFLVIEDGKPRPLPREPYLRRPRHYSMYVTGTCPGSYAIVDRYSRDLPCRACNTSGYEEVPDDCQYEVWQLIGRQHPPLSVGDWLTLLAGNAAHQVADRLARVGLLIADPYRTLLGRVRERWVPASAPEAERPRIRLRGIAEQRERPTAEDLVVAGLADALTLHHSILSGLPDAAQGHLAALMRSLDPQLLELIACTKTAADSAITASR